MNNESYLITEKACQVLKDKGYELTEKPQHYGTINEINEKEYLFFAIKKVGRFLVNCTDKEIERYADEDETATTDQVNEIFMVLEEMTKEILLKKIF